MQKPWFLQRSMPSCTFPRNLHRNAKHYVRLPRFILKTKHQSSFILPKILLKIDSECDTMSKTTKNLRGSFKTSPRRFKILLRRLQDAHKTPPSRLQAASKSFASPHGASSRLQAASKTPQDASKTAKHASTQPPRCLQETAQDVAKVLSQRHEL